MKFLWHWLKDCWVEHQAFTLQAPSHHAHPQGSTPILGIVKDVYL